jgi:hydroxymethylpyrimidine pyrophosphatase-like HAD family hydrolase
MKKHDLYQYSTQCVWEDLMAQAEYFLIDVDDTIFKIGGAPPLGFYEALQELKGFIELCNAREFQPIGGCTGRELVHVKKLFWTLEELDTWSVFEGGIFLGNMKTGERINHPRLTEETVDIFMNGIRPAIPALVQRYPDLSPYMDKEIHVALERANPLINLEHYVPRVREYLAEFDGSFDLMTSSLAIDILVKEINKGSSAIELSKETGVPLENIVMIGDSRGDFPAMEVVGLVGCPSNASEECKDFVRKKGGKISERPWVEGVIDIIKDYA